ncbi:eukaryotic translation initiation factor eIF1a-like protein [Thermochaetoides thermophila DSM 1495]|uniref:Eukaryotic translation initiation factor eIF1a-like protein n=1 Tax=Chaetomium thermophilum (strain DSM 1495 / CBS 144.50 / IMI 039719) TaxID=759272 RepID=G0S7P5_CHATD|nr:eukaryotic translation initiation factor eIF1a-like protein [Thermochaetoides thermophila DSM 1495]EGS21836.1 eukaryotic translation initiation factor eIF1a-like protein [Thermochaetoides thermophila DSM 1495]
MGRIRRAVKVLQNTAHAPDELGENQHICQVVKVEGNLTYTCKLPTGEELKASLEKKFHDTIFIRVRGYVVVEIDEVARSKNCKVIGKIVNVVCNEKEWRQQPYWPKEFPRIIVQNGPPSPGYQMPPSDSEDNVENH